MDDGTNLLDLKDYNGRMGNEYKQMEKVMGPDRDKVRNGNYEWILELRIGNDLLIANTKFEHKDMHNVTNDEHRRMKNQ